MKRICQVIPVMFIISFIVFFMIHLVPGDPVRNLLGIEATAEAIEATREELGLNKPLPVQYMNYLRNISKGDLGTSIFTKESVTSQIKERFPITLKIAVGATAISIVFGVLFGIIAALNHNKFMDSIIMFFSLLSVSVPIFFLAILLILLFSVNLGWFPSVGAKTSKHFILPIITLGMQSIGIMARVTRSAMLDVLGEDYMRTAKANGVSYGMMIFKYGLKNALIPIITVIGLRFGGLLVGAAITETVFTIPGIGRLMVEGVLQRDYPVVQGTILFLALIFVVVNLITDIFYAAVDPRVTYD